MSGAADGAEVLFICDFDPPFTGRTYHESGVGGTEAIVVLLAEELVRRGRRVVVANRGSTAVENGVTYQPLESVADLQPAVVVLVKQWSPSAPGRGAVRMFLATDVHVPDPAPIARCRQWAHHVCALSTFQRSYIERATGPGTIHVIGAPVNTYDYRNAPGARDSILLYCSVPDRGLYYLKDIFPRIRRRVPDARLVITSDFTLWARPSAKTGFERFFAGQPGVEYLGHVPRPELVRQQMRARVMAYPCSFPEGFCVAAAECLSAGAVPVTTDAYALSTTVGEAGILIKGRPRSWLYQRRFVHAACRLLEDDEYWMARSRGCRERAASCYSPPQVVTRLMDAAGT